VGTDDWLIEVADLGYTYPDGTRALCGVDLRVPQGVKAGLIGPNASGKSTLLLCLDGFLRGQEGRIRIAGLDVCKANLKAIRSLVGLLFQDPDDQLFMPTLWDDVSFGPVNQGLDAARVRARTREALEQVGLAGLEDKAPHHLSLGQKRNAAIATVLAMRPQVLLLDEPSSNLDPRSRRQLIRLLAGMSITMILASHDLGMVAELCSEVHVIDAGRIVAHGPTRQVLADASLMEAHGLEVPAGLEPGPVGKG